MFTVETILYVVFSFIHKSENVKNLQNHMGFGTKRKISLAYAPNELKWTFLFFLFFFQF